MAISQEEASISTGSSEIRKFELNERVLCFHGPLIYEAKIVNIKEGEMKKSYLVHYTRWSKKWDEYVPHERLLKCTEENLALQKQKEKALKLGNRPVSGRKSLSKTPSAKDKVVQPKKSTLSCDVKIVTPSTSITSKLSVVTTSSLEDEHKPLLESKSTASSSGTNNNNIQASTNETCGRNKLEVQVDIEPNLCDSRTLEFILPGKIKEMLVDDNDQINRRKKLVKVPGRYTVESLLNKYKDHIYQTKSNQISTCELDFFDGIKDLFNLLLGPQLLYRFERLQYSSICSEKTVDDCSENASFGHKVNVALIYGPIHLMRMFTKMDFALATTNVETQAVQLLQKFVHDFLEYITRESEEFFHPLDDYFVPSAEYQRNAPV